jgi:hypothetical protein
MKPGRAAPADPDYSLIGIGAKTDRLISTFAPRGNLDYTFTHHYVSSCSRLPRRRKDMDTWLLASSLPSLAQPLL